MTIEEAVVARIVPSSFAGLEPTTVSAARAAIIDTLGVAVAGRVSPRLNALWAFTVAETRAGDCTLIASPGRAGAADAVLLNSTMAHAYDFDDTHDIGVVHAGVTVIPSALAMAELVGASGQEFLTAIVLGVELVCRLALATWDGPNTSGWMLTPLYGTFGAAAAAGYLLHLDTDQMQHALGLAYCQAAGNVQCVPDGALAKRLQAGFSARAGVTAALLAQRGLTGPQHFLDGPFGLGRVYHRKRFTSSAVLQDWGAPYAITQLSFKPYPTCRFTHSAIDATIALMRAMNLQPDEIDTIRVQVNAQALAATGEPLAVKRQPRTVVDAQFSIPYAVATAVLKRNFTLSDLDPAALTDRRTLALAHRVLVEDGFAGNQEWQRRISPATVTVETQGDARYEATVQVPRGHFTAPLQEHELAEKFLACWEHTYPRDSERGRTLLQRLTQVEELPNLGPVTTLLGLAN